MRVLLIARASLYTVVGGDTVQIVNTAKNLQLLGVSADIRLTNEKIDYEEYDLLHFFNIIRPADILLHIRKSNKPFVVSPIFVDYTQFDKVRREGIAGIIFRMLPAESIEFLKAVARSILNSERIVSPSYLFMGQRRSIRYILRKTLMLLPNSKSEYERLRNRYKISAPFHVIPNAVDPDIFQLNKTSNSREEDLVLCVGRIEGIKNQLALIHALNGSEFRLLIIGSPAPNQMWYYKACRQLAGPNIKFVDRMSQHELTAYYARAKVHVLPSWFETTGLSTLEAAVSGCNVVITDKGDTREYFDDFAYYCDPGSSESILNAVTRASRDPVKPAFSNYVLNHYTWEIAAKLTLAAYNQILINPKN